MKGTSLNTIVKLSTNFKDHPFNLIFNKFKNFNVVNESKMSKILVKLLVVLTL